MIKLSIVHFLLMLVLQGFLQGCSQETRGDLKEMGQDMKTDVNRTARDVDNKAEDAVN